jgi:hypothetical protein
MGLLRCELKDHEADDIAPLPIRKPNGDLQTFACLEHAKELGFFCEAHQRIHLGFDDGSHACVVCIEEKVEKADPRIGPWYWGLLKKHLSEDEFTMILAEALEAHDETMEHPTKLLLRWIITAAERHGKLDQEIVQEVIDSGSVGLILPPITGLEETR